MNKNLIHIFTVLESIEKIFLYTNSFSSASHFYSSMDQLHFNAALKLLGVIGEEVGKMDENLLAIIPDIPWRAIIGTRNLLVHDYRGIDKEIVFSIIQVELPVLKEGLTEIYNSLKPTLNQQDIQEIINTEFYKHLSYLL